MDGDFAEGEDELIVKLEEVSSWESLSLTAEQMLDQSQPCSSRGKARADRRHCPAHASMHGDLVTLPDPKLDAERPTKLLDMKAHVEMRAVDARENARIEYQNESQRPCAILVARCAATR